MWKRILLVLLLLIIISCNNQPKIGQTWIWKNNNPFNPIVKEYIILDIKNDYIKYKELETGYIDSMHSSLFLIGSKLKPHN